MNLVRRFRRSLAALAATLVATNGLLAQELAVDVPSTRLFHISANRFTREASGQGQLETGWLSATGQYTVASKSPTVLPFNMPEAGIGKLLVYTEVWYTLGQQGPHARANFRLAGSQTPLVLGNLVYYEVEPHPHARLDAGAMINISTRGFVGTGQPLIGGFVIRDHPRKVVIRAIGPTLAAFLVAQPLKNPTLALYSGQNQTHENDDWSTGSPSAVDAIATTFTQVGAFALPLGSRDAALVVELPVGSYTAQIRSADATSGEALIEVYVIP